MSDKAVITCALNGVLTDPKQHHVPVTPEEMAREAKAAFNAGASVMHIHLRQQAPNKGHLPSWEIAVSREVQQAIREACPGVIINHTTGTSGPNYQGALDCVRETKPEMAACNAGSLNYLKVKADNTWAWPPMMFDNAVEKVQDYLDVMKQAGTIPASCAASGCTGRPGCIPDRWSIISSWASPRACRPIRICCRSC
jgi:3-keto-5-aminohexanoate cleavage enzyme